MYSPVTSFASLDNLTITSNGDSAKMRFKATNENGKTVEVSGFGLNADNVLFIEENDKATVTDDVKFTEALLTYPINNKERIDITNDGVVDFSDYNQGIYTLDVVVDDKKAYEAIVVIGEEDEQTVNNEITRIANKQITIFESEEEEEDGDKEEGCSNKEGSAGLKYPLDDVTECEKIGYDECEKNKTLPDSIECEILEETFLDDDCHGFENQEECNAFYEDSDAFCETHDRPYRCNNVNPLPTTPEPTPEPSPEPSPQATITANEDPNAEDKSVEVEPEEEIVEEPEEDVSQEETGRDIDNSEDTVSGN